MTRLSILLVAAALAACQQPASEPAEAPAAEASNGGLVVAAAPPDDPIRATDLAGACREAASRLAGQPEVVIDFEATGAAAGNVAWRAPVDGGRLVMQCAMADDVVSLSVNGQERGLFSTLPMPEGAAG